jgi:hypothetical protein
VIDRAPSCLTSEIWDFGQIWEQVTGAEDHGNIAQNYPRPFKRDLSHIYFEPEELKLFLTIGGFLDEGRSDSWIHRSRT